MSSCHMISVATTASSSVRSMIWSLQASSLSGAASCAGICFCNRVRDCGNQADLLTTNSQTPSACQSGCTSRRQASLVLTLLIVSHVCLIRSAMCWTRNKPRLDTYVELQVTMSSWNFAAKSFHPSTSSLIPFPVTLRQRQLSPSEFLVDDREVLVIVNPRVEESSHHQSSWSR